MQPIILSKLESRSKLSFKTRSKLAPSPHMHMLTNNLQALISEVIQFAGEVFKTFSEQIYFSLTKKLSEKDLRRRSEEEVRTLESSEDLESGKPNMS